MENSRDKFEPPENFVAFVTTLLKEELQPAKLTSSQQVTIERENTKAQWYSLVKSSNVTMYLVKTSKQVMISRHHLSLYRSIYLHLSFYLLELTIVFTALVFFDPPRVVPGNATLQIFPIDKYMDVYAAVALLNEAKDWVFVCTCALLELGNLYHKFLELPPSAKKSIDLKVTYPTLLLHFTIPHS
jgi:hypothetical protein